ncbi:hypothetical protein G7Y79_00001g003520 [Physcia stellaris]|nr:hypothetical protein G7Y79_00001g003520 [Physcia stellaris]
MTARRTASETSPLLPKGKTLSSEPAETPNRVLSNTNCTNIHAQEDLKSINEEQGKSNGEENNDEQYQGLPEVKKQLRYIIPAVAIGIFLAAGDQTIIVSTYGVIGSDLQALNKTSWIATSYFLTLTSFQPLYGKLSDIFGRKSALLFAYAVFGLGCLFCGLARNMGELVAARMVAGIGGGGMTTVVSILMSDVVTLRERGVWQGIVNIIYATGAGCGAPLGGILADSIGLSWAKYPSDSSHWKKKLKRVDFLGAFVLVGAVFTLLLGLDRGSNESWGALVTIASLCTSLVAFFLFVLIELKIAVEPFAPGRVVFGKSLFACYLCNFFSLGCYLAVLFYLPLFFQARDGLSAAQAGIRLLPGVVAGVTGSLYGGFIIRRTGRYYWLTIWAYIFQILEMIPIILCTGMATNNTYGIAVGFVIVGISNGIGVTATLIGLIANATQEDQAVATACSYLFRSLGSVVGISLTSTVVQQALRHQLQEKLGSSDDAATIMRNVRESLEYLKTLDPAIQELIRQCYGNAITAGFGLLIAIASLAAISSGEFPYRTLEAAANL